MVVLILRCPMARISTRTPTPREANAVAKLRRPLWLLGITRRTVIEIAQSLGIPVQVRPVSASEFRAADEAFISSSGGGVLPVTRVDGSPIADGAIGPITRKLSDTYWAWHQDPAMHLAVAY